jgi:hypothetical protein
MSNENDADSGGGLALVAEKKGGRSHRRTRFAKKTPAPSLSGVGETDHIASLVGGEAVLPQPRRGVMNGEEKRFLREFIEPQVSAGFILDSEFEGVKVILTDSIPPIQPTPTEPTGQRAIPATYYTPDFFCLTRSGIVIYEMKGVWETAARLTIKMAAERHRWARFIAVQRVSKKWVFERFF